MLTKIVRWENVLFGIYVSPICYLGYGHTTFFFKVYANLVDRCERIKTTKNKQTNNKQTKQQKQRHSNGIMNTQNTLLLVE